MGTGALKAQGVVLKRGDGATPTEVFSAVGDITGVAGVDGGSNTEIDVTDLSSTAREFLQGLKDGGSATLSGFLNTSDTQQTGLRTDRDNGTLRNFELDLTDSGPTTISFSAIVTSFTIDAQVDSAIALSITLKISGNPVWA
jgi:predicted secreted protein